MQPLVPGSIAHILPKTARITYWVQKGLELKGADYEKLRDLFDMVRICEDIATADVLARFSK